MVLGLCLITTSQRMTYLLLLNTYVLCDAQLTTALVIVCVDASFFSFTFMYSVYDVNIK